MGRLPFEPGKMKGAGRSEGDRPLTVSQLARRIGDALAAGIPGRVRVVGEVSGLRERTHLYFDLKDAEAVIGCVMFATSTKRASYLPESGREVVATGRVDFWGKGGRTSLVVEKVEPVGAGALELAFRRLCEELRGLGYFDEERKRPLPLLPRRVAVVTSRTGAALQDVLDTAKRRCPAVGWLVVDARVQGESAAGEVARAIRHLGTARAQLGIDAILVTRGGGSAEDLWAFNEREVADAIFESPLPVVAAIGHETDTTVAELVADRRAATPTQAAMMLVPDGAALLDELGTTVRRMARELERRLRHEAERLRSAARVPVFGDPRSLVRARSDELRRAVLTLERVAHARARVARARLTSSNDRLERHRPLKVHARRSARLDSAVLRLHAAVAARLAPERLDGLEARLGRTLGRVGANASKRLGSAARTLRAVGPESVLDRGYSWTLGPDGTVLRDAAAVSPGQRLVTRLGEGSVASRVEGPGGAPPIRRRKRGADRDQMDLFGAGG